MNNSKLECTQTVKSSCAKSLEITNINYVKNIKILMQKTLSILLCQTLPSIYHFDPHMNKIQAECSQNLDSFLAKVSLLLHFMITHHKKNNILFF